MGIFSKRSSTPPPVPDDAVPEVTEPVPEEAAPPVPDEKEQELAEKKAREAKMQDRLEQAFDSAYYLSKNPDVLKKGFDPLTHYLKFGWKENRRPNSWFNPVEYVQRHPELLDSDTIPFLHFLTYRDQPEGVLDKALSALRKNRVLYWADKYLADDEGLRPLIVSSNMPGPEELNLARKHFDEEYYTSQNQDVADKWVSPLLHFMTLGWIEMRDPNPDFSVSYYLRKNQDIRRQGINPFIHYHKHGYRENWRPSATVADAAILDLFEDNADMQALIAQAKHFEPMVAMPNAARKITSPLKAERRSVVAQALRRKLAGKSYRYIIAVPHVRMSGASRVASIFADALAQVRDPSEILVITTDSSESEYIGWFADKLDIFDLSKEIETLGPEDKIRALIDLMRGVNCKTIINVNSRLVWDAMCLFGRQIHHEFRVVTYLFTWDENVKGDRVGYPIQWLRDTADHHHLLLTDTKNLANDVSDRLGFDHEAGDAQVLPLYTPVTADAGIVANPDRPANRAGHFLWAGRFDPQKRVDVLVGIARANPDMTFDVYGKTVLGKNDLSSYDPPENIIFKGTYTDLQEVLNTPYSGFLYTAQWDGLPTILLDMAAAGVPIVAPNVGGIAEMLDASTGWLVEDYQDVEGYGAALTQMAANPTDARARVEALRTRLESQFASEGYINSIKKMVKTYDL